LLLEIIKHMLL